MFDVWKQKTTLDTTLHEGTDKSGPVVGACVLRRGLGDLIRMLPTAHATGTALLADQAAAITRFGRFFAGHSWDSYAAHLGRDD